MTWIDDDVRNRVLKCFRYFHKAILEDDENDIDAKFLFMWIALECLSKTISSTQYPVCKNCGKKIYECIHCKADTSFEPSEKTLIKDLLVKELGIISNSDFNNLYSIRSALVHSGKPAASNISIIAGGVQIFNTLIPKAIELVLSKNLLDAQIDDEETLNFWGFSKKGNQTIASP